MDTRIIVIALGKQHIKLKAFFNKLNMDPFSEETHAALQTSKQTKDLGNVCLKLQSVTFVVKNKQKHLLGKHIKSIFLTSPNSQW